jgi:hypothetical protein
MTTRRSDRDDVIDLDDLHADIEVVTAITSLVGGFLAAAVLVEESGPFGDDFCVLSADLDTAAVVGFLLDLFCVDEGGLSREQWLAEALRHAPATRALLEEMKRERVH